VTELLKSDSICESYAQMKKGPVFLTRSVSTACFSHYMQHRVSILVRRLLLNVPILVRRLLLTVFFDSQCSYAQSQTAVAWDQGSVWPTFSNGESRNVEWPHFFTTVQFVNFASLLGIYWHACTIALESFGSRGFAPDTNWVWLICSYHLPSS